MEAPYPALDATPLAVLVDRDGLIADVDSRWDERLETFGLEAPRRSEILGQPFASFLEPRRAEVWKRWTETLADLDEPPTTRDPVLNGLRTWRARGGVWLSLGSSAIDWPSRPLMRVEGGKLTALNDAGRRLLEGESDDLRRLESRLADRQPPLHLAAVPDLRLDGRPVFALQTPPLYDIAAFDLLARVVRAGLHDLSNPLAAMRMLVEVILRGGAVAPEPGTSLEDVVSYLDKAIDVIHGLRSLIYADAAVGVLEPRRELERAISLLRSDLSRRDLSVAIEDRGGGVEVVTSASAFRLLIGAGILATSGRAAEGDRLILKLDESDAGLLLACDVEPGGLPAPILADPLPDRALFHRLATSCDGRVLLMPGERGDRSPDWQVEIGAG